MSARQETSLMPSRLVHDPFTLMREMTSAVDRMFDELSWPSLRRPLFRMQRGAEPSWYPAIDVFEKDNRLVTKLDLPGMKKSVDL